MKAGPGARARAPGRASALSAGGLARDREFGPAIALPAAFVRLVAELDLFAVRDGLQPVGGYAEGDHVVVSVLGPPLPEGEVVLDGPALVAVPLDGDPEEVELLEHFRVLAQDRPVTLADVGLVVLVVDLGEKAHAVDLVRGHGLDTGVLVRHRGRGRLAGGGRSGGRRGRSGGGRRRGRSHGLLAAAGESERSQE